MNNHPNDSKTSDRWCVRMFGEVMGPMPFSSLQELAENESLSPSDEVRSSDDDVWGEAEDVPGLFTVDSLSLSIGSVASHCCAGTPQTTNSSAWYTDALPTAAKPLTLDQLLRLIANGKVGADDRVKQGEGEWQLARSFTPLLTALLDFRIRQNPSQNEPVNVRVITGRNRKTSNQRKRRRRDTKPEDVSDAFLFEVLGRPGSVNSEFTTSCSTKDVSVEESPAPKDIRHADSAESIVAVTGIQPERKERSARKFRLAGFPVDFFRSQLLPLLAGVTVIILLGVFLLCVVRSDGNAIDLSQLKSLLTEVNRMRASDTPEAEWILFRQRAEKVRDEILNKIADNIAGQPVRRQILFAARDFLLPMIDEAAASNHGSSVSSPLSLAKFEECLRHADQLLDGRVPETPGVIAPPDLE